MPKKILIFSTAYLPFVGGAEIAIKEITARLEEIQFDLITLRFDRALPKFEKLGNVNIYRIGFTANKPNMSDLVKWPLKLNKYIFPFAAAGAACRLNRKNNYDGIWAMMAAFAGFAAVFFKLCHKNTPYLLTLQEGDPIEEIKKKVRLVYPLFKRIFIKADFIQVISNYLAGYARGMGYQGELAVVPNGVDVKKFKVESLKLKVKDIKNKLAFAENDKIIITTSRLVEKNGVGDLIEAMRYLPANVKLLIIGAGELEKNYKLQITNYKLEGRVIMLGEIKNELIPEYLSIADVFVRPSLSEGQGIAFLEAMAAGVPIIATPVGGIVDFLRDGETGLFCRVSDPASIAAKIKILFANKEMAEALRNNAGELVRKNYGWDSIAVKMEKIFNQLTV